MTPDHEFTIRTLDLDAGGKDFRFVLRPAWIRGQLEDHEATAATTKDGVIAVRASKSGADVVVHGTMDATVNVPCARCLESFDFAMHADLSVIYVPGSKVKDSSKDGDVEYTLEDAEADTLPFDGDTVVLDDLIRDELVLGVPMIPLCSEACPGMSPAPGSNDATPEGRIDPRLAPLLQLRLGDKTTKT